MTSCLEQEMGITDTSLHQGIIQALQSAYGKNVRIADIKQFGAAGIQALASSVAQEQAAQQKKVRKGRPSTMVQFEIPHHHTTFELPWKFGESLLDVAKSVQGQELLGEYMEGTCGGTMSCCTCHVYLDSETYAALEPPCKAEKDMLDLAYNPVEGQSRLGCQVQLNEELLKLQKQGTSSITVTIPSSVNNIWN